MASTRVSTVVRVAILVLALLVFLGNIMMWIIMPTDTYYNDWLLKILAATNSTFFGIQGPIMLDFTFPILFIAVLGCVYLHLGKRKTTFTTRRCNKFMFMKRPMIIKGLGIVNLTELALFTMFIALNVWYFSDYVRHWFHLVPQLNSTRRETVWQTKFDRVAIVFGLTGNLCLTFLFYPVTRGSSILGMIGVTSESSIKYHIWLGHMAMGLFTTHGVLYITYWGMTNRLSEMVRWVGVSNGITNVSNIAGELSLLCGLSMWITSYPSIRRKMFEIFYYTHHLHIPLIIFFIFHAGIGFACIMLPGLYLFIIDRYLRLLQSRGSVRLFSARVLPCNTLELNFSRSKGLRYNPTSTIFLNVPCISRMQWHPFTVTSSSNLDKDTLSVVIKCEGTWSKKLYDMVSSPSPVNRLLVSVEGPYGPGSTDFLSHEKLVMISGGSGITPFISILRELIFISSTEKCKIPKIMMICVFKNSSHLSMLELLLPATNISTNSTNLDLQVEAYVTREMNGLNSIDANSVHTVYFKPHPTDAPISPTLGPNSWLWLAVIISSSFIIFLISLGLFTQYVIYPIEKNGTNIYPFTAKGAMNMLFICFSIITAATTAFLWNKRQNFKEAQQILSLEDSQNGIEMESLPLQSMIRSINVQYDQRPDLKKTLLEMRESSVGVLVSGPKEMKQDVARICSSKHVDNLHFQAISFTW